ncbi:MAG: IMPACT family protein [Candidatus Wenzhouxiangella sp. M2_3B_020]
MNRLTGIGHAERTVRNSRFVGVCGPARDESEAREFVAARGEAGCRHVCWAFRCGDVVRFDDAGEPGGTAGRPILAALEHFELDRSVAVVSRWFGGVKLGTGGLARAYGGTAMDALSSAPTAPIVAMASMLCSVPFDAANDLHLLIDRFGAEKIDETWTREGLEVRLRLPEASRNAFSARLVENTRGTGRCETGRGAGY